MGRCCYDNDCFDLIEAALEVYPSGYCYHVDCCCDNDCFDFVEAGYCYYVDCCYDNDCFDFAEASLDT